MRDSYAVMGVRVYYDSVSSPSTVSMQASERGQTTEQND